MAGIFQNGVYINSFAYPGTPSQIFEFATGSFTTAVTRFGVGQSLNPALNNFDGKNLGVQLATIIEGIWFYTDQLPSSGWQVLRMWYDSTAGSNQQQVSLQYNAAGALQFFRGQTTSNPLGSPTASGLVAPLRGMYLETSVTFNPTTGVVILNVWGTGGGGASPVISASGLNTVNSGHNFCDRTYFFGNAQAGHNHYFQYWYMLDTTGSAPLNTFLGNGTIVADAVNSDATPNQFSTQPSQTTGNHYKNVDQIPWTTDADYNFDDNPGDIEAYGFPADLTNAPLFLNFVYRCWLDAAGARTVESICKSGSATTTGPVITPSTTPSFFNQIVTLDPNTGLPWTTSPANAAIIEIEVVT